MSGLRQRDIYVRSTRPVTSASPWRLVNLALGLSAVIGFAGAFGVLPSLAPTRWLFEPWVSSSSLATVSPLAVATARIGIDFWLVASVLMAVFWLSGLHRRLDAPKARWASAGLGSASAASIATSVALPLLGGRSEASGASIFVVGMLLVPVYLTATIAGSVAAVSELTAMYRHGDSTFSHVSAKLLAWALIPPVLLLVPLLLASGNPFTSRPEVTAFANACKDVGVRLMEKPSTPIRSIAYDWDPNRLMTRPMVDRIELVGGDRIHLLGGFAKLNSVEAQKKPLLDFTESRRDFFRAGRASINPDAPYYHFPASSASQPYYGVATLTADALVFIDVDKTEELRKAPMHQGAVRYTLTLTDRRSGAALGTQTFVVDRANNRACGANVGNTISQAAFIYDAIRR